GTGTMSVSPSPSSVGRDQFSVEKEYTVSSLTPSSAASRRRALTVSAPALWPSLTETPRARAQRLLPSVMIATYRAVGSSEPLSPADAGAAAGHIRLPGSPLPWS